MSDRGAVNRDRSPAVAALRGLVGASVACVARVDPVGVEVLFPAEVGFVSNAAAGRIADFCTGRDCARLALRQLGLPTQAIPVGPDREPLWPDGVVGSITHCAGFYAAAVARTVELRGIGIDAERSETVDRSLEWLILSSEERYWLNQCSEETRDLLRAVLFSIKESVFKCLFPLTGTFLEFHDVEVRIAHSAAVPVAPNAVARTVKSWVAGPSPAMTRGDARHDAGMRGHDTGMRGYDTGVGAGPDTAGGFMQGGLIGGWWGAATDFVAFITGGTDIPDCLRRVHGRYGHCDGFVLSVAEVPVRPRR